MASAIAQPWWCDCCILDWSLVHILPALVLAAPVPVFCWCTYPSSFKHFSRLSGSARFYTFWAWLKGWTRLAHARMLMAVMDCADFTQAEQARAMAQKLVSHHNLCRWGVLAPWWCFSGGPGIPLRPWDSCLEVGTGTNGRGRELLCVERLGTAFCFMTGGMAVSSSIKSCLPSHTCHLGPVTVNYGKVKAKSHLVCCTGDECRTTSVSCKLFFFLIDLPFSVWSIPCFGLPG